MGLFKKAKRALGYEDPKLRERGIRGTAKVLSSERTMMSEESGSGRNVHIYKHRLLVTVPGSDPFEVTYRKPGGLTEGGEYRAYVDPKDPSNVFVDAAAMAREHAADELSEQTGKPVGSDVGSILDSTAGLIDDARKQMWTAPPGRAAWRGSDAIGRGAGAGVARRGVPHDSVVTAGGASQPG
jgi:hypothetical protein